MICRYCDRDKPVTEFHRLTRTGMKLRGYCKDCHKEAYRDRAHRLRKVCLEYYSSNKMSCACCGERIFEFLTLDHISGGGRKHREEVGKGLKFYSWLIKNDFPEGFRVLCYNCNCAMGHHGGVCPHELERLVKK